MPTELFGVPIYLAAAVLFIAAAVAIGLARGRSSGSGEVRARGAVRLDLQTISAVLGILSFALQILQWLKIIG